MFALQRRGVTYSRHNWKADAQRLLKFIEENRVINVLDMTDPLNHGKILVEMVLDLSEINCMLRNMGWSELEAEKPEEGAPE